MTMLRRDRQQAGSREIVLEWIICTSCRHVGLDRWAFESETPTDETTPKDRRPA